MAQFRAQAQTMQRREFITMVGGTAMAWPLASRAQQVGKLRTIGFLGADASSFSPWTAAFVARLRELGWIEDRNIAVEYRWSEGRIERYTEIAAEAAAGLSEALAACSRRRRSLGP